MRGNWDVLRWRGGWIAWVALIVAIVLGQPGAGGAEFRAMWVDAFHAGLRNGTETSAVLSAARTAKCNAIVVQVRKRGDAYYRNGLEPVATDVSANFDPLADLIQKAHNGTPRVEIHAWLVSYNIWSSQNTPPSQPTHPYNLHPDWLTQNTAGTLFDGSNYALDPGHPAVQDHNYKVAMDILTRYDVDGIHLDYIRYSENGSTVGSQPWGYNPVAVSRYRVQKNLTSTPTPTDSAWLQWRRDQVTALVRKIYLNAWAKKPNVRISAALIPWGTAPANGTLSAWQSTNAYGRVLQDWRGWLEEGILDLACPMVYRTDIGGYQAWADYTKDKQYSRAAAIGGGWYLNSISNTIAQIKGARTTTAAGRTAAGVVGYSYAVPNADSTSSTTTWAALTDDATAETYDPGGTPVFQDLPAMPAMPWKSNALFGGLMGTLTWSDFNTATDGATIQISGPVSRTITADGTGFFGVIDIPIGTYNVTVTTRGGETITKQVTVEGSKITDAPAQVKRKPFRVISVSRGAGQLAISWNSVPGRKYQVQSSPDLQTWTPVTVSSTATAESTAYSWMIPVNYGPRAYLRVVEQP